MPFLRQSTAQTVRFGPFLDATDGVTEETGLTITPALRRLSKDGGAFAAASGAVNATHDSDGWYSASLTTADTDTVGELILNVQVPATHLPVWMRWWVLEEEVYDDMFGAAAVGYLKPVTAGRDLDVTATGAAGIDWGNVENQTTAVDLSATDIQLCDTVTTLTGHTAQTGDSFARLGAPAGASVSADIAAVKVDTAAILVDTAEIGVAGAGLTNITINAASVDAVWDEDATAHQTLGTFGQAIGDPVANTKTIYAAVVTDASGASVGVDTTAIVADTNELQTDWVDGGRLDLIIDAILVDTTGLNGDVMRGTDSAALASVCTEARLAELDAANLPSTTDDILTDTAVIGALGAGLTDITDRLPAALTKGTADSGTNATMVDAARTEADTDFWAGMWIRFTSGTISGQVRLITGFTPASDTITFAPVTTQAVATNTYEIIPAGATGVDWGNVLRATTAVDLSATDIQLCDTVTTLTGHTAQTGDSFARLGAPAGASVSADIAAIQSDTDDIQTRLPAALVGGRMDSSVGAMAADVLTAAAIATDAIGSLELSTAAVNEIRDSILSDSTPFAGANINATISSRATPAQVNTEVLDVLTVDTFAEPPQETPAATTTMEDKIGYIYKFMRNRLTTTATQISLFNDDAVTIDHRSTISDDGTTFDRTEYVSGP